MYLDDTSRFIGCEIRKTFVTRKLCVTPALKQIKYPIIAQCSWLVWQVGLLTGSVLADLHLGLGHSCQCHFWLNVVVSSSTCWCCIFRLWNIIPTPFQCRCSTWSRSVRTSYNFLSSRL